MLTPNGQRKTASELDGGAERAKYSTAKTKRISKWQSHQVQVRLLLEKAKRKEKASTPKVNIHGTKTVKIIKKHTEVKVSEYVYSLVDRLIDEKCDRLKKNRKNPQNRTVSIIEHTKRKLLL
jgi:hypothetical protein